MVKVAIFVLLVMLVAVFPLVMQEYDYNISEKNAPKTLPMVFFKDGKYKIYNKKLDKKGVFSTFKIYPNRYEATNLSVEELIKKDRIFAKEALFKKNKIFGKDVVFNKEGFTLTSDKAVFDKIRHTIKGENFYFYAEDYRGKGKRFYIDKKRNIDAEDITYYLKVK